MAEKISWRTHSRYGPHLPWLLAAAAVILVGSFIQQSVDAYFFQIIMYAGINIVLAVSLNLVNGFTGQFSMGHAGFMSVGGYVAAYVSTLIVTSNPGVLATGAGSFAVFATAMAAGGAAAAAVGLLVGLPSLRLKGDYLAIVTLGFGEIIRVVITNMEAVGGARGLPGIPAIATFTWVYMMALATIFTVSRLVRAPYGREMISVREDEIAAVAMGVNNTAAKVRAFVIGATFAGFAGALFGHFLTYLNPTIFDFNRSFEIIIMVVLGGMGSITGSVIAAIFLTVLREGLRSLQSITQVDFRMIIYSLMLIILMLTRPNGLFGTREVTDFIPWLRKRRNSAGGGTRHD